jgi:hypothetical protein
MSPDDVPKWLAIPMIYPGWTMALGGLIFCVGLYYWVWPPNVSATGSKPEPAASTPGPNFKFEGPSNNQFNFNPPTPQPTAPAQPADTGVIQQAGVEVGKVFGARRSPSDATTFEFAEITNCAQFNTGAPFVYNGVRLQFVTERTSAMMVMGRTDNPIRFGVIARVLE